MVSPKRCLEYMSGLLALFSPFRAVGCTCLFVDTKAWWVTSLLNPDEKNPTLTVKGGNAARGIKNYPYNNLYRPGVKQVGFFQLLFQEPTEGKDSISVWY